MILLRRLLGDVLRNERQQQGRTLREVSSSARVSLGYLSEVERGQKEASSELLGAIASALDVPLSTLLREVSDELALAELTSGELAADRPAERIVLAPLRENDRPAADADRPVNGTVSALRVAHAAA